MRPIVDTGKVEGLLAAGHIPSGKEVGSVLEKAVNLKGLDLEDVALLIRAGNHQVRLEDITTAAGQVKEMVFGRRIVLFAPIYLTSDCINNCLYCGFRKDNVLASRATLSTGDAVREAGNLERMGFKRILLVAGESPAASNIDRMVEVVKAIYKNTDIRIIHVNAAPMKAADLRRLKAAGAGVFQVFQETYHEGTYKKMHPSGPKSDYRKRIQALDGAMEAGFDDVGMGALLGLYDWRFEVLSVVAHARHLYKRFGAWPHTISAPRLKPATGSPVSSSPYPVSDNEFKMIVAIYRLAVPAAGVVVSTREPAILRDEVLKTGASQLSAGSRTDPGGYSQKEQRFDASQFMIGDHRSLEEMVEHIAQNGFIPSLCTACYRTGRTGKVFTEKVSHMEMERYCLPNALLTLKEYAMEHANGGAPTCNEVIGKNVPLITDIKLRSATINKLLRIEAGERDLYF